MQMSESVFDSHLHHFTMKCLERIHKFFYHGHPSSVVNIILILFAMKIEYSNDKTSVNFTALAGLGLEEYLAVCHRQICPQG